MAHCYSQLSLEPDEGLLITEELEGRKEYITTKLVDREFEIRARSQLVEVYKNMQQAKIRQRKLIQTALLLSFPKEFLNLEFSDVLRDIGQPETTEEVIQALIKFGNSHASQAANSFSSVQQSSLLPPLPPTAKKGFGPSYVNQTPQQQQHCVHNFESAFKAIPPSAVKKEPRMAKPGEQVFAFSATGSPIDVASNKINNNFGTPAKSARVKVDAGNGQMIDVDLVFRGGPADARNKIVTDFRCWAKTRSTVQNRKQLPHRPLLKKNGSLSRQQKF